MQVYDRVVPNNAVNTLYVLFVGVLISIALEALLKTTRIKLLDQTGKAIELELSQRFYNKSLTIRMDARPSTVGTFASQIREFESVKSFLTSSTLFVIADAPFAIIFLMVIFAIGGHVGIVALCALPITLLIGYLVQKPLGELTKQHQQESSIKNGMLIESIDGAESIKATGGEGWFSKRWYNLSLLIGNTGLKTRYIANLSGTLAAAVQQICYATTIVVGVFAIAKGELTMGGLIACSILISRVLSPITQLASMAVSWQSAKVGLDSLNDLMARPNAGPEPGVVPVKLDVFLPSLRLENIKVHYGADKVLAFETETLEIKPGERVAIVGSMGSGKSTLLKILTGLYKPSEGRAFASGVDMQLLEPDRLRAQVGYLPQDVRLFNGTLRENLCLGIKTPSDDELMRVCEMTGLDKLIAKHPRGISLPISEGGRGLSGGQKQMVGFSRVLLQSPSILLLDEPTASLDHNNEVHLIKKLKDFIKPEQTLIIVTHKMPILELVTRMIVIDQNRIMLDGPVDAVMRKISGVPSNTKPTAPVEHKNTPAAQ